MLGCIDVARHVRRVQPHAQRAWHWGSSIVEDSFTPGSNAHSVPPIYNQKQARLSPIACYFLVRLFILNPICLKQTSILFHDRTRQTGKGLEDGYARIDTGKRIWIPCTGTSFAFRDGILHRVSSNLGLAWRETESTG